MNSNNLNGHIDGTETEVQVGTIDLKLSHKDAWMLCNILTPGTLDAVKFALDDEHIQRLLRIGVSIAKLIDHPARGSWTALHGKGQKE